MKSKVFYRTVCCVFLMIAILAFTGCEDDSLEAQLERAKKASNAAQETYEQSKGKYNDMLDDFADYKKSQEYLNSFK